mgnify:CR=1 FL=1
MGRGIKKDLDIMDATPWLRRPMEFYDKFGELTSHTDVTHREDQDTLDDMLKNYDITSLLSEEEIAEYTNEIEERKLEHDKKIDRLWSIAKGSLTTLQFECFYLYHVEEFKQDEIAKVMKIDQSMVALHIKTAIKNIVEEMKEIERLKVGFKDMRTRGII